ncbi:MAG TPA: DUF1501 domain-containing protein [Gammaproteobacteria bacterium]|nr:DUF1501 domain-containing protein [Gammaproteobacteria bacterium]
MRDKISRRNFLKSCAAATALGSFGGMRLALSGGSLGTDNVLVVLFLRGACDGLSLFPPVSGEDRSIYEAARPTLQIPLTGSHAAIDLDGQFGLHPAAAPLKPIFDQGQLAIVRAVGNTVVPSRSHFDAQAYLESGLAGTRNFDSGWLTRLFQTFPDLPEEILLPSVAASTYTPSSFLGDTSVLTMDSPSNFQLNTTHWAWDSRQLEVLPSLFNGTDTIQVAGGQAATALQAVTNMDFDSYVPEGGATYPDSYFAKQMKMIAQLIKDQTAGLRVATLDVGGWDTHNGQDTTDFTGWFSNNLAGPLAQNLASLITDLGASGDHLQRTTIVVQTEFGRRLAENGDQGTDHGYGADMLLLGGAVNGGQFYGQWPGLQTQALFQGEDVNVTTDFRHVLSEVIVRRMQNPDLASIFPGYSSYQPLGVVQGTDLEPQPPLNGLFADGFEG